MRARWQETFGCLLVASVLVACSSSAPAQSSAQVATSLLGEFGCSFGVMIPETSTKAEYYKCEKTTDDEQIRMSELALGPLIAIPYSKSEVNLQMAFDFQNDGAGWHEVWNSNEPLADGNSWAVFWAGSEKADREIALVLDAWRTRQ